jgi:transposase
MELMAAQLWVAGASHTQVAKECGVSPATVKAWATTASRVLRIGMEPQTEEIRKQSLQQLEVIVAQAIASRELRAGVAALELRAKMLGHIVHRHDVTTRPKVAHLSREEHEAELGKLKIEIDEELYRIAMQGTGT